MKTVLGVILGGILLGVSFAPTSASQSEAGRARKPAEKTPLDHLRAARTSLDEVKQDSLTSDAAGKVKDIRQRLAMLEQSYVSHGKKTMSQRETASGGTRVRIGHEGNWSSQVPDIDKLLGELIDPNASIAKPQDANDVVKRKLAAVRTHLTAFAKGASGTGGPKE